MSSRPLRYVAIGDSLSEGVGDVLWPDGNPRGWTDRLAELFAAKFGSVEYANLAVRGYRSFDILEKQLEPTLAMEPDVVTVSAGMNDLLRRKTDFEDLRRNLIDLTKPLVASGAQVTYIPIPDITNVTPVGRLIERRRVRLNALYEMLSDQYGAEPIALKAAGTVFEDRRAWDSDRLHLSPLGHERLALAVAVTLGHSSDDWATPPIGLSPARSLRTELNWFREHVLPWFGRRIRGKYAGFGRHPKRPELTRFDHFGAPPLT